MTKSEVLAIFAQSKLPLKPDDVRGRLRPIPNRRSFYTYLLRLAKQGLLERDHLSGGGRLVYWITTRGRVRLNYLRERTG
jgi:hypothetical protein